MRSRSCSECLGFLGVLNDNGLEDICNILGFIGCGFERLDDSLHHPPMKEHYGTNDNGVHAFTGFSQNLWKTAGKAGF
jgi:hypothetical protein